VSDTTKNTLHTRYTPSHPLNTGYTTITRIPYPMQSAQVEPKSGRVQVPGWRPDYDAASALYEEAGKNLNINNPLT